MNRIVLNPHDTTKANNLPWILNYLHFKSKRIAKIHEAIKCLRSNLNETIPNNNNLNDFANL